MGIIQYTYCISTEWARLRDFIAITLDVCVLYEALVFIEYASDSCPAFWRGHVSSESLETTGKKKLARCNHGTYSIRLTVHSAIQVASFAEPSAKELCV